jgi:hypothetical protein
MRAWYGIKTSALYDQHMFLITEAANAQLTETLP